MERRFREDHNRRIFFDSGWGSDDEVGIHYTSSDEELGDEGGSFHKSRIDDIGVDVHDRFGDDAEGAARRAGHQSWNNRFRYRVEVQSSGVVQSEEVLPKRSSCSSWSWMCSRRPKVAKAMM